MCNQSRTGFDLGFRSAGAAGLLVESPTVKQEKMMLRITQHPVLLVFLFTLVSIQGAVFQESEASPSSREEAEVEDREIRQITAELKLEHKDFIAVRSDYRHHLSVLKKSKGG